MCKSTIIQICIAIADSRSSALQSNEDWKHVKENFLDLHSQDWKQKLCKEEEHVSNDEDSLVVFQSSQFKLNFDKNFEQINSGANAEQSQESERINNFLNQQEIDATHEENL